ncbi:patatin-like phospholipase domain-containing protein 2 [Osmerus eperlanus]|uniref:patatin-like phospholipase domain-containing protein 2 n=1 Tax=Osmerus eperlanus TaxID=29151 RepID=UPI002E0FB795
MLNLEGEWSISFAGCGFMGIYYVGASACLLEHVSHLVQDASKMYGASSGALMAAVLTVGMPIEQCCENLMYMAKEARKRKLGPLHPSFNLLKIVRDAMVRHLPDDAHIRATGKLCVSLTRVSDGQNVLASEFDTKEELIQALLCSCFIPFYCGVIPPTYRGVSYVDGAISNNLPHCKMPNTITVSPFSGKSGICPRDSTMNFHEVRFNNVSIQVNTENMYRVTSAFFPPEPEIMAEICHNGYMDTLRFLQENNLLRTGSPSTSWLTEVDSPKPSCCETEYDPTEAEETESANNLLLKPQRKPHWWLDPQRTENLPVLIKKVLCEACKERHTGGLLAQGTELLPGRVASFMLMPYTLPVKAAYSMTQKLVNWIPDVSCDMRWLYSMAGDIYKQAWKSTDDKINSEGPLRRCCSLPSGLEVCAQKEKEQDLSSLPDTINTNYLYCSTCDNQPELPLTPPSTPPTKSMLKKGASPSKIGGGWGSGLSRAVGWMRGNASSEQSSSPSSSKDKQSSP